MRFIFVLVLTLILSSCARDNIRIFGGINTDFKNENQIVLSYDPTFELGDILKDTYKIAKEHCEVYGKNAILTSKTGGVFSGFRTVSFECKKK